MSYDLMVFERTKAPTTKKEFMAWYEKQTEWEEGHDYQTISVSSPALQNWFLHQCGQPSVNLRQVSAQVND